MALPSSPSRTDQVYRALVAGFVATACAAFVLLVAYALSSWLGQTIPGALGHWFVRLTSNQATSLVQDALARALLLHIVVGLGWALVYVLWAEPRLSGPGWLRGMTFSLLPAIISILALLPLGGGGFLGWALGAGPFPIFGNLILHLAYGTALGAVYGPLGDVPADYSPGGAADDLATTRRSEVPIARGIVAGLVVGLLISMGVAVLLHAAPGTPILDVPQAAFVLGATVVGGAFGGFLGSFAGLAGQA
jgi:hypothetical protein